MFKVFTVCCYSWRGRETAVSGLDRLNFPIEEKRDVSKLLIAAEHRYGETYVQPKYVMRPAFNQARCPA